MSNNNEEEIASLKARIATLESDFIILKQALPQLFPSPVRAPAQHSTADQIIDRAFRSSEVARQLAEGVSDDVMKAVMRDNRTIHR